MENLAPEIPEMSVDTSTAYLFDTREPFEQWLRSLHTSPDHLASVAGEIEKSILLEGLETSNCEVEFDGILQVDGLLKGKIRSAFGTLVKTEQGHVEADVEVRIAIIDGYLEGNLRATDHVVLNSRAHVAGNIHTPQLLVRDGAVFEGQSFLLDRSTDSTFSEDEGQVEMLQALTVGA